jgi:predicted transposase YdaD
VQVDELQVGETRHRYGVVRLWEQDPLPLLQNPALLPLATLARPVIPANNKASKKGNEPRTAIAAAAHLALVAERVAAIRNPVLQKEIAGGCHLLAGLVFSQELINAYFTMGILDDSVTYQAAVAEYTRRGRLEGLAEGERHGEQRGRQQGLRQGLHQGLKEGELQGKQQEAQALVLRQLPRRCGQLSQSQELAVRALSLEQLEALAEALLDFDGPEALDAWLAV